MTARVLVVDDDKEVRATLSDLLAELGVAVATAGDGSEALELAARAAPDVVLLDLCMPRLDGMACLERLRRVCPEASAIVVTAHGDIPSAVRATKLGAHDYITKPFDGEVLLSAVRRAVERAAPGGAGRAPGAPREGPGGLARVLGGSPEIQFVLFQVRQVARTNFTVLIQGETGTGKELVARAIHQGSDRRGRPFLAVDCGAIPETLIESQLFGHERGAFTGAAARREGDFELAAGGTLLLDEVGNLPLGTQAKLLRVLQERQVRRLGGKQVIPVDARIVAASNADLEGEARRGVFRQDLFHRLNEFAIFIPPLRERREDVLCLAEAFLAEVRAELEKPIRGFSAAAAKLLEEYAWPGNVREVRNVVRRAALLCGDMIEPEDLRLSPGGRPSATDIAARGDGVTAGLPLKEIRRSALREVDRRAVRAALEASGGNRTRAARLLGVDQKTLRAAIKDLGIRAREFAGQSGQ